MPEHIFRELDAAHASLPFELAAKARLKEQVALERARATVLARTASTAWAYAARADARHTAAEAALVASEAEGDQLRRELASEARWSGLRTGLLIALSVAGTFALVHVARSTL